MVSWHAGCIAHHLGTDMIKLQRIRLNHKVTGALWKWKGYLWQSHFCRLLKPVVLFKGHQLICQVWVYVSKEGQSSSTWGGTRAEMLMGEAPAGWRGRERRASGGGRHEWKKTGARRAALKRLMKDHSPLALLLPLHLSALRTPWPTASCSPLASSQSGEAQGGGRWDTSNSKARKT